MISLGGMFSVNHIQEFEKHVESFTRGKLTASEIGQINLNFILKNKGAANKIMNYL